MGNVVDCLNALAQVGNTLAHAANSMTGFASNLSQSVATVEPTTAIVIGILSFATMVVVGYYALLSV
jgi:hypothetical protein